MAIPRYLVENHGPGKEAAKTILRESIQLAESTEIEKITLVVPVKGSFPSTVLGELLGDKASKSLCKGEILNLGDGVSLELTTPKQLSPFSNYGVVIGVYLSQSDLNKLDSIRSAKAIAYIPWMEDEGKAWQATWSPVTWGESTWCEVPPSLPLDAERELQRLTRVINISTGLAHPSDKDSAKLAIKKIKSIVPNISPEDIRRWAIKNGWQPRHAEDLSKLVKR